MEDQEKISMESYQERILQHRKVSYVKGFFAGAVLGIFTGYYMGVSTERRLNPPAIQQPQPTHIPQLNKSLSTKLK